MPQDAASSDAMTRRLRPPVLLGLGITLVVTVLDQVTKEIAEALLVPGRFVPLLGEHIGWQLVYNPGGAFGVRAPHWLFLIVTVIVVLVVARALPRTHSKLTGSAYGLLLSGALGNVIDRLFREGLPDAPAFGGGAVVDFVAWGTFPRFNLADSAITVGFVLLVLALWREERHHERASGPDGPVAPADADADDGGTSAPPEDPPHAAHTGEDPAASDGPDRSGHPEGDDDPPPGRDETPRGRDDVSRSLDGHAVPAETEDIGARR